MSKPKPSETTQTFVVETDGEKLALSITKRSRMLVSVSVEGVPLNGGALEEFCEICAGLVRDWRRTKKTESENR